MQPIAGKPALADARRYPEKMKKRKDIRFGIAWYRENQWELLRSTAFDSENIEDTYQDWLESAEDSMEKLKRQGFEPVKVYLDVEDFNEWCGRKGRIRDAVSRSEYTADLLRRIDNYRGRG
jgi:hypothetical protein